MPTLEELVAQLPPRPTRMQQRPVHPKLAAEHDRFVEMLPELMRTYKDKWIAMKDGEVIAVADDEVSALTAAYRSRGGLLFLAVKVTDQPLPIERIPIGRPREIGPVKPLVQADIPQIVDKSRG